MRPIGSASAIEKVAPLPVPVTGRHFRLGLRAGTPWTLACLLVDAVMLALAATAAAFGTAAAGVAPVSPAWSGAFGALTMLVLGLSGLYAPWFRLRTLDDLRRVAGATTLAALLLLSLAAVLDASRGAVDEVVRLWAFATVYVGAGRAALYWSQVQARRAGEGLRPTLIVGAGRVGRLTAKRLLDCPDLGLKPVGFLDKDPLAVSDDDGVHLPVLGASWDLETVVREQGVEQVIVGFSTAPNEVLLRLVRRCEELGVAVAFVPRLYERTTTRLTVEHIGGLPIVSAHPADPAGWQYALKYAADRVVAAALVTLLAPVLAAAALATLLSVGRPILFRQRRVGRDGREFDMLKFRTMRGAPEDRGEADADWARAQLGEVQPNGDVEGHVLAPPVAAGEDPRTPAGRFLRKLSIDELPQLFNVLLGHMSLVGPRPERVHYVRAFERQVYRYADRHRVKSGITGWAQVNGLRGKTSLADRVEWDNHYIENFSLWLDVKILAMTVAAVFRTSRQVE